MGLFTKKRGRMKQKWKYNAKSNLLSGPMVYDIDQDDKTEIVFGTKDGRIILMDDNSNVRWIYDIKEEVGAVDSFFQDPEGANSITSTPVIGDINDNGMNEIIFGSEMGIVYALNNTGEIDWKFKADGAVRTRVLLHDINQDGMLEVIFGCMDGNLYVLSARGELLWKYEGETPIESTPAVIPEYNWFLFGCHDGTVKCVNYKKDKVWQYKTDGKVVAKPVVEDLYGNGNNVIIVGSTDYSMYVLNDEGGLIWSYKTGGSILSEASVDDINEDGKKEVVFGSCDNKVYALTNEGDTIWTYETYFWVVAPPIIADIDNDGKKEVVVGSYDHNLYVLDSEGTYSLDYVPGLGGVIHQSGHYSSFMTKEPGRMQADKIWQYQTNGFIVGCALDEKYNNIIINVKEGTVQSLMHEN